MSEIVESVKQIAAGVMNAAQPSGVYIGTVTSASPLRILVDEMTEELGAAQLSLTSLVSDITVDMTVDHATEDAQDHRHAYKGTKTFTVHLGLQPGERVILLRNQGGQKFFVLDRVR